MSEEAPGADDTIRVLPQPRGKRGRGFAIAAAAVVVVLLAGSIAGWLLRQPRPTALPVPTAPPASVPAPQSTVAPAVFRIETADERQIRDHVPNDLTVFRFADNPNILVLDFASLHEQGMMLNRIAALVEKAGLPRDRVLTDEELDAAIRAQGDTMETFYYGHDYPASALARFFALVDAQHVALYPEEQKLRALLQQVGWFAPHVAAGLISIPAVGANANVTLDARAAILRHELSHGEFFSNRGYADYVRDFWLTALTGPERAAFRAFLAKENYDTSEEELMYNEMQAYLMFTRDELFFAPAMIGMSDGELARLQRAFFDGMPRGWLRDVLASTLPDQPP